MRRHRDPLTLDIFEVPQQAAPLTGSHDLDVPLRQALTDAITASGKDRWEIGAEVSRLTGRNVTKYMLDAYTADSREGHNFPFRYAAAFEMATGSYALTNLLAKHRGGRVLLGEDAILAEITRIEQEEHALVGELRQQKRALTDLLRKRRRT